VPRWLRDLREAAPSDIVIMLMGNQCDLNERRAVTTEEGAEFAKTENLLFIETSALDATNVQEAFEKLITKIVHKVPLAAPPRPTNTAAPSLKSEGLELSAKGLANVASLGIRDFSIRVGDWRVECSRFEASFLSPRITAALLQDPTITEYEIELDGDVTVNGKLSADFEKVLSDLLSLTRNISFDVTLSNFDEVKCVVKALGNVELSERLVQMQNDMEELNLSNVGGRLSVAEFLDVSPTPEIEYLASHFYEVEVSVLKSLKHEHLRAILESDKLQIETEDSLLDFVLELGEGCFDLLGQVRSEYLSESGIDRLLDTISIDDVGGALWSSLCRRLRLSVQISLTQTSRFYRRSFPFDSRRPFEGIMSYLRGKCGGNVHTFGIVPITSSSDGRNHCYRVADYNWDEYWYSNNTANSWIQFDFKDRNISVTKYTIKSGRNDGYLVQWSLSGSNDEESWTILDERHTQDLNGPDHVRSFECKGDQSSTSSFRFIRLTQTGPNSSNRHNLQIANLEFYGRITH
jgi:hypothetical protein